MCNAKTTSLVMVHHRRCSTSWPSRAQFVMSISAINQHVHSAIILLGSVKMFRDHVCLQGFRRCSSASGLHLGEKMLSHYSSIRKWAREPCVLKWRNTVSDMEIHQTFACCISHRHLSLFYDNISFDLLNCLQASRVASIYRFRFTPCLFHEGVSIGELYDMIGKSP